MVHYLFNTPTYSFYKKLNKVTINGKNRINFFTISIIGKKNRNISYLYIPCKKSFYCMQICAEKDNEVKIPQAFKAGDIKIIKLQKIIIETDPSVTEVNREFSKTP